MTFKSAFGTHQYDDNVITFAEVILVTQHGISRAANVKKKQKQKVEPHLNDIELIVLTEEC